MKAIVMKEYQLARLKNNRDCRTCMHGSPLRCEETCSGMPEPSNYRHFDKIIHVKQTTARNLYVIKEQGDKFIHASHLILVTPLEELVLEL